MFIIHVDLGFIMSKYISLNRQFSPVSKNHKEAEEFEQSFNFSFGELELWDSLLDEYRCIVLAEAGAGKTVEFMEKATLLENEGKLAFFIRTEDIDRQFYDSFEVGNEDRFNSWLDSTEEAWFFLDSVDEALLSSPRAFEKAIIRFSKAIKKGAHRAHIYISSRPYSWRAKDDQELMDSALFIPSIEEAKQLDSSGNEKPSSALKIYSLQPLDKQRISEYCDVRGIEDTKQLLDEVDRLGLWNLAERPFDLDAIIAKWANDKSLDGRLKLLQYNIDVRLKESHSNARDALNTDKARDGAQRLAAAVILTGNVGINIPDSEYTKKGIDADIVLYDWDKKNVKKLLESALFNDIMYGAVRFRHRDIRELLAAEFFSKLLKDSSNRSQIESYFFKESLDESIVTPLLRPLLPWLILFDDNICTKALKIKPEIGVEGGDPSQLPFCRRQKILLEIVNNISNNIYEHYAGDNTAIARIAQPDLTKDILKLINSHHDNDNVISFLSRFVSQGGMADCTEALIPIAVNGKRNKYAKISSIKAVMSCGSEQQKFDMWQDINDSNDTILRKVLMELVDGATPTMKIVDLILHTIPKLIIQNTFEPSGLSSSLSDFIQRADSKIVSNLLNGIFSYLKTEPHIERGECQISEQYAWLVSIALKCIEELILIRDSYALSDVSLSILVNAAELRYWQAESLQELKHNLDKLVSQWSKLNDALYWYSIEKQREHLNDKGEVLTNEQSILFPDPYWSFNIADFHRLLTFIKSRSLSDDRLIALSTAFRVYHQADLPVNMLKELRDAVAENDILMTKLENLLNPVISKSMQEYEEKSAERFLKGKAKKIEQEKARKDWIITLRSDPSRINNPPVVKGKITNNHVWLVEELGKNSSITTRQHNILWQSLIPEFGKEVAVAYKDFCMQHWRNYRPILRSEEKVGNSFSSSLLIALAGLEIESTEVANFPKNLNPSELDMALRYLTWDINGFPNWFEKIHREFPKATEDAVLKELIWELETPKHEHSLNHILHDLVYYAPWLHEYIASKVLENLMHSSSPLYSCKEYCVRILIEGGIEPEKLTKLARKYITLSLDNNNEIAWWFALLVDNSPDIGIPEFESWLSDLNDDSAINAAEIFIVALLGGSHSQKSLYCTGKFKTVPHLKALYVLMHRYIKTSHDIQRAGKGVYSPITRDHAQEARDMLFNYLVEIPSKESYYALKQLIEEHPDESYRPLMRKRAYKIAESYGNITPWSDQQFKEFHQSRILFPETHRQLFELAVQQLNALKDWIENGNDSPWLTWQRATEENEVRTLIAAELRKQSKGHYTTTEEPELANEQRMDIWLANPDVQSPVPIELKLLDKNWTGPNLCERLRNQLVGDYLREESAGCGIFLLVSQKTTKRWTIDGKKIGIEELASALKEYWKTISYKYSGIEEIEVIVINMNKRALVCDT